MNYLAVMQICMRRLGLFAGFIILCFLSLYQYLRFDKTKSILLSIIEKQKDEFHRQIVKRESAYYAMKEIIDMQFQNEGRRMQPDDIVCEDGNKFYCLKDVIHSECIVVRLSQNNCSPCINALMTILQKQNMHNTIFFVNYENEQFLDDLKKYKVQSRFFKAGLLPLPIDSLNIPYCFVVDKALNIDNIFIPNKDVLDQTIQYFEVMNRRLLH